MFKLRYIALTILVSNLLTACNDDSGSTLAPVNERVDAAIAELRSELVAPAEGWRLEYQPTPDAGIFFMLLEFDNEGEVRIQSDVVANEGEFFNQTIPYRIDNSLGLELVFETFGVFHHLFELDQAGFGAEFEFIFQRREGENLVFQSKSDISTPTVITLEPASSGDANLFSRELAGNLEQFGDLSPQALVSVAPSQQVILEDLDVSVFWVFDPSKRNITAEFAGNGRTRQEIIDNGGFRLIDHSTGYSMINGNLVLQEPLTFVINRREITIGQITLNDFEPNGGPSLCAINAETTPKYDGFAQNLGSVSVVNSLISSRGNDFQENVYQINIDFLFDGDGNALIDDGIIGDLFPNTGGFVMFYGVELVNEDIPIYSLGLILDDGEIYVREFEETSTEGNLITLSFTDTFFHSDTAAVGDEDKLRQITDEIFSGGEVYAFDFPQDDVFRLFNPCNEYEIFLVR
ncbi:MAG: DUF4302 domain-containing protein [Bacteroidota bacterium]